LRWLSWKLVRLKWWLHWKWRLVLQGWWSRSFLRWLGNFLDWLWRWIGTCLPELVASKRRCFIELHSRRSRCWRMLPKFVVTEWRLETCVVWGGA
jgi:hypothetical protein